MPNPLLPPFWILSFCQRALLKNKNDQAHKFVTVIAQSLSHVQLFVTRWTETCQPSLDFTIFRSLLRLMSTELVMPSNYLVLCHPLLLLPSVFPSIRVFSNESVLCIRWPKYWSFSISISPSNEYWGLISFRMDWLEFLAVQGTLKSLLQHRSSKGPVLWSSAFFMVQLSHPYMTPGKTIALTRRTFVGKIMSMLCNMLSLEEIPRCQCVHCEGQTSREVRVSTVCIKAFKWSANEVVRNAYTPQ